jgi:hypothetical protein
MTTEAKKPTLKVNDTPSEQVVAQAKAEVTITDEQGRSIVLRKPPILAEYRIVEAMGDSAMNAVYHAMVAPLIFVSSINGDEVELPTTKRQIEALIQRLDHDGIKAVNKSVQENWGVKDPEAEKDSRKE